MTYFSILKAITAGKTRLSELPAALEMKATTLSPYLTTLIDLHLIERRVPVTEPSPEHSKKRQVSYSGQLPAVLVFVRLP